MTVSEQKKIDEGWLEDAAQKWEQRKANEAAREAEEQRRADAERQRLELEERRLESELDALERERRRLDEEHALRVAERKRIERERAELEAMRVRVVESEKADHDLQAERRRLDEAAALRKAERLKLEDEAQRIESERAAIDKAEREEAAARATLGQKREEKVERVMSLRERAAEAKRKADDERARRDEERRRAVDEIERRNLERVAAENPAAAAANAAKPGTRRRTRVHLHASVMIKAEGGRHIVLPVRDMSLSGLYLSAEPRDLPSLPPVGATLELMLFASDDVSREVDVKAKVVRHAPDGIAIDWSEDLAATYRIALLMETLPTRT